MWAGGLTRIKLIEELPTASKALLCQLSWAIEQLLTDPHRIVQARSELYTVRVRRSGSLRCGSGGAAGHARGKEGALARVINVFGEARLHNAYLFANRRANRMKKLVNDAPCRPQAARLVQSFARYCSGRRPLAAPGGPDGPFQRPSNADFAPGPSVRTTLFELLQSWHFSSARGLSKPMASA